MEKSPERRNRCSPPSFRRWEWPFPGPTGLESGQIKSISELARTLDVDGSYVARILKLTTLAPDIVEALINGEEPNGLSLAKLTQTFPEDWAEQRRQFGFATD
ncbi:hypothetical protein [Candidatus Macondimonas diazotrophica]|uniref:Uncharacterized protein n=1 Tax=Candidatus Macondimonas diazotrophica TaxID=2305248 RepID=A0A4Z0F826_9GAMM|nr:hypothetical protein [Candidatus Macondimonas diazotrophica]TFZ82494.1 hypothetical protein E4680_08425 [Candidatus Macondimonas diazotrophica]